MDFKLLQFQTRAIIPDHDSHPSIGLPHINPHMVSGLHGVTQDILQDNFHRVRLEGGTPGVHCILPGAGR